MIFASASRGERGRMAELSLIDELGEEQRSELDTIEKSTPDLERQLRAAVIALEIEEREAETRAVNEPGHRTARAYRASLQGAC